MEPDMRPVVLRMDVTLDGFVHGAKGYEDWGLPVIGHGTTLFSVLREPLRLDLVEARTFPTGTAIHVYRPHTF